MASNGLGIVLFDCAEWMLARGYSRNTVHQYTQAVEHFGYWRSQSHPSSGQPKQSEVSEFLLLHLPKCACPAPAATTIRTCRAALARLMTFLGQSPQRELSGHQSGLIPVLVADFDTYMEEVCGLSAATRRYRRRYAREFLEWRFKRRRLDVGALRVDDAIRYVQARAPRLRPESLCVMNVSLRAFARFLESRRLCRAGLSEAWPTVARWKQAPPLPTLNERQCQELIDSAAPGSAAQKRDRAMLSLILGLGLRTSEIAAIQLDDIDWGAGVIAVRHSKQRRERVLPLPQPVGAAISGYLLDERPACSSRSLFVCHRIPKGAPITPERVRGAVRRAMARAGLERGGPHLLRHSFATVLHSRGVCLKELSDLLGHRHLDTTAIYARVNLTQLRQVALPWPTAEL